MHILLHKNFANSVLKTIIPDGLEKEMSLSLDIKLVFIYSFQFSRSSLGTLGGNGFKHLNLNFAVKY